MVSAAGIIRCSNCRVIKCFQKKMGNKYVIVVELSAILLGLNLCKQQNMLNVTIESDSKCVIDVLNSSYIVPTGKYTI